MAWTYLLIAIFGEVVGTSALKASEGFTKLGPSVLCAASFMLTFYFLGLALRVIPVGVAYAIWSAVGIVAISLIGFVIFGQRLDMAALVGIGLILAGVVVIHTLSNTTGH